MTTIIKNVNLNLVSDTNLAGYRDRVIASGVALLACYAVHSYYYSSSALSSNSLSLSLELKIDFLL